MKFARHILPALALCASAGNSQALTVTDSTFGVAYNGRETRTLTIGSGATISDVNITIDFGKCSMHAMSPGQSTCPLILPWIPAIGDVRTSEIFFYLISPAGTRVELVFTYDFVSSIYGAEQGSTKAYGTYPSGLNVNNLNAESRHVVTFDDQAADAVGPLLIDGSFRPEEALSVLNSENALGDWILGYGTSDYGPLSYFSATLIINGGGDAAVPAPASLALLLAGLGVLGVTRRRQA